jgi:hypothetical protein
MKKTETQSNLNRQGAKTQRFDTDCTNCHDL